MTPPVCVRCGGPVGPYHFKTRSGDATPAPVCASCRGGSGGRAAAARATNRKAQKLIDTTLSARGKGDRG